MTKPLKAYQVDHYEGPEEGSVVVFATNSAAARREGGSELGGGWDDAGSCRRAQAFDQYAPGPVPIEAKLAAGWHYFCDHHDCQQRIEEGGYLVEDEDGNEELVTSAYVVRKSQIFCTQECLAVHDAKRRSKHAAEAALLELVEAKFAGCTVVNLHIYGHELEPSDPKDAKCFAYFTYPGSQYAATYHFGDGSMAYVPQIDVPAFEALYRTNK